MIDLYFAPGACSIVPHVALEMVKAATGTPFEPKLIKLHKGEHKAPEYLALNPNGQVPTLVVDGRPLTQIVAMLEYLDAQYPQARILPSEPWVRANALSQLAWMNNTAHPTFAHFFMPQLFADSDAGKTEIKALAAQRFRECLERIQGWTAHANPYLCGAQLTPVDVYAWTLLRWGGYAGIDPKSLPAYLAYAERVMQAPAVAAALARERIGLDTYKAA